MAFDDARTKHYQGCELRIRRAGGDPDRPFEGMLRRADNGTFLASGHYASAEEAEAAMIDTVHDILDKAPYMTR